MIKKKRNYITNHFKFLLVIVTIFLILIPLVLGDLKFDSNTVLNDPYPEISDFSKDDFTAILTEEKHGLGNISINDIDFSDLEMGFITYNETYPLIGEDIFSKDLNITLLNIQFVATIDPAIVDNLNENITDSNSITVKLNESLFVEYNDLTEGYLIYLPRLVPCDLLQFSVNNGTNIFELIDETDYTVDKDNFIVFSYESYFNISVTTNFTMYLIWEYTLELTDWSLSQIIGDEELIIEDEEQDFTTWFNYYFILTGKKYNESILIPDEPIFADNIDIALTINHPDKDLFTNHILELNNETVDIAGHLNPDDSIDVYLADHFSGELSEFSLNFTIQFTFKFIEPVGETWAIDRLVEMDNIRQRIYFASIINGPQHIYFKYLSFYEPTIYADQILSSSSLFERDFEYFFLNTTLTGRYGIKINVPYLIIGETCPFIIKYKPTQTLRVVVLDNIKMPLVGAEVKVYYFDQEYGTYVSKDKAQPISPGKTDESGEILLLHVPAGNYTIRVYHNGIFLKESTCSTYNYRNYIFTNFPHFPFWVIIFGVINGIILILGLIFYSKSKKMR